MSLVEGSSSQVAADRVDAAEEPLAEQGTRFSLWRSW
jgi:hypothetical protein